MKVDLTYLYNGPLEGNVYEVEITTREVKVSSLQESSDLEAMFSKALGQVLEDQGLTGKDLVSTLLQLGLLSAYDINEWQEGQNEL